MMNTHWKHIVMVLLLTGAVSCSGEWDKETPAWGNVLQIRVADAITSGGWNDASARSVAPDATVLKETSPGIVDIGDGWAVSTYVTNRYTPLAAEPEKAETRGTPIHAAVKLPTIGIAVYDSKTSNFSTSTLLWRRVQVVNQNLTGSWSIPGEAVAWPKDDYQLSFLAFSPYPSNAAGLVWASDGRTIDYTVPADVTKQPDLCLAAPITNRTNIAGSGNHIINLSLQHALTAVTIKASAHKVKLISATVKNVKTKGTLNLSNNDVVWSNITTNGNRAAAIGERVESAEMKDITNVDGHLMMVPQTLDDAAVLELIFDDLSVTPNKRVTKTVRLNTLSPGKWEAGKQVFYNLQLKTEFGLTLSPTEVYLFRDAGAYSTGINYTTNSLSPPTVSVNQGWISNLQVNVNSGIITFDYSENTGSADRTAMITVTAGLTTKTVKVTQSSNKATSLPESNCYILPPNGANVQIPVTRANVGGTTRVSATDAITAELLWQDTPGAVGSPTSCISSVKAFGVGSSARIEVKSGNVTGNGLVVVKVNGVIRWSWHIWVTTVAEKTYNGKTWLDRNLGATSNAQGNAASIGLIYEWGRKDPFAGSNSLSQSSAKPLYNASGARLSDHKCVNAYNIASNFENAIKEPMIYYHTKMYSPPYQWTGTQGGRYDDLWSSTQKTVYDPCPLGYRVPSMEEMQKINGFSSYSQSNRGAIHPQLGFFPYSGSRSCWNGRLEGTGGSGNWWTTDLTINSSYSDGRYISIRSGGMSNGSYTKTCGYSIRCIKE